VHEWREHTAEVELVIEAASPEEVCAEAALAFAELVGPPAGDSQPRSRAVHLDARDRASLLVDWIEELIYLADTEGFLPSEASVRLTDASLSARLDGGVGAIDPLVKAATYHGLSFEQQEGRWHAHVVLDV
jgi:SHS2 domain-containing protein